MTDRRKILAFIFILLYPKQDGGKIHEYWIRREHPFMGNPAFLLYMSKSDKRWCSMFPFTADFFLHGKNENSTSAKTTKLNSKTQVTGIKKGPDFVISVLFNPYEVFQWLPLPPVSWYPPFASTPGKTYPALNGNQYSVFYGITIPEKRESHFS